MLLGKLCANCNRLNPKDAVKCLGCDGIALENIYSWIEFEDIEAENEESKDVS